MFDFGNDDKEKLRENMEQIKDLVNDGRSVGEDELGEGFEEPEEELDRDSPGEGQLFDTPGQQEDTDSFDGQQESQQQDAQQDIQSFDDQGQGPEQEQDIQSFSSGQEEDLEQELDEFEEKFGGGQQEGQQQQAAQPQQSQQEQQSAQSFKDTGQEQSGQEQQQSGQGQQASNTPPENQQRSETTKGGVKDSRDLSSEVPNPPETRELNVPDIDRGPLFLRQRKFLRAKQMIEDMLYLSDEMEKTVNDLEAGLQEDKDIERDVVDILREFEDNRTEVEDIISPREE